MPTPSITASLIVRNEEKFLEGCLRSVAGLVDEIVVVDTGSIDGTRDIARRFGARLLDFPWHNDFAAARNFGLDAATGAWILYIDADERIDVPAGASLSDGLDRTDAVAARVRFRPRLDQTLYLEYRLFRNDKRIRFHGAMHETIIPAITQLIDAGQGAVIDVPATINHLGYEGDQTHKHVRNLPLLEQAVIDDPGRLYYWQHLAETLDALGRKSEAIDACQRGLAIARHPERTREKFLGVFLSFRLARLLHEAGEDAMPVVDEGFGFFPGYKSLLFLKARLLLERDEHDAALAILDDLTSIDADTFCDPRVSYDRRIFGAYAHDLAGVAHLRLGNRPAAAAAFARAAAFEPGDPTFLRKAQALGWTGQ